MADHVNVDRRGAVAIVRLDRPKVNALSVQLVDELHAACDELAGDRTIRAAVVYGGERTFSAGADLKEMADGSPDDVRRRVGALQDVCNRLEALPIVTIAAVTGYALGGGCEIAMACDFRIATPNAKVGQPEIVVGLIPGAGGTQRLPRLVGPARAKWMIFTGEFVDAPKAYEWGLVDEIAETDVLGVALDRATRYAEGPTLSLAAAKRAIDHGVRSDGYELELDEFVKLFDTRDTRHGLESFERDGAGKASYEGR